MKAKTFETVQNVAGILWLGAMGGIVYTVFNPSWLNLAAQACGASC